MTLKAGKKSQTSGSKTTLIQALWTGLKEKQEEAIKAYAGFASILLLNGN
jgi:hypothetical protein